MEKRDIYYPYWLVLLLSSLPFKCLRLNAL
jgi:hypothetical protein